MILANPLRLRNWLHMTWLPDDTGMLYRHGSGWRIRLSSHLLKNGASAKRRSYDVQVAGWLVPRLEAYLEKYRECLHGGSKYLFPSAKTGGRWDGLGARIRKLTKKYIPGCPGIGPHGFRHLVATYWLSRNANDYLIVAELLNDNIVTVMKCYAHLRRDTSFSKYEDAISALLKGG